MHGCGGTFYAPCAREETQILQVKPSKSVEMIGGHFTHPSPHVGRQYADHAMDMAGSMATGTAIVRHPTVVRDHLSFTHWP
jgi:hypothetical protein